MSMAVSSACPGIPFLKRLLTRPFFPCGAMIVPLILCSSIGHATFLPMSWDASFRVLTFGNLRMHSFVP